MNRALLRKSLLALSLLLIPILGVVFWRALSTEQTLPILAAKADQAGAAMLEDLRSLPAKDIKEENDHYTIEEDGKSGIDISFASDVIPIGVDGSSSARTAVGPLESGLTADPAKQQTTLSLPKDYSQPIEVKLDDQRSVLITDLNGTKNYSSVILSDSEGSGDSGSSAISSGAGGAVPSAILNTVKNFVGLDSSPSAQNDRKSYLSYTSPDDRITHLYAYQKDQASGEKKLKSWTLYRYGLGKEVESYKIENAKIKIDEDGNAKVFFFGDQDMKSEQAKADVDPNLMDRAQKFLQQETGNDIMNNGNAIPDFTIPKPTYFTKDGVEHEARWNVIPTSSSVILSDSEGSSSSVIAGESSTAAIQDSGTNSVILSVALTENPDQYPLALDPTLSFTAPGSTSGGDAIAGETGSELGYAMTAGDFNGDGKIDLAVGARGYSTNTGRVYIFYQDGSFASSSVSADVVITGEATGNYFGSSLVSGDFNSDGKADLAVGAYGYSSNAGRAYIFYNDGSYPTTAATADAIITGEASSNFGKTLSAGDFNVDGKTDLVASTYAYSSNTGRAYIFYNDGSYPTAAVSADVIITGEATSSYFGISLASGDFNADGRADLAVGAVGYSSSAGRIYIFHGGSILTENASGADVILTGNGTDSLGASLVIGDFNVDGKDDVVTGAAGGANTTGKAYIFYGGSMISETASGADVSIGGTSSGHYFGNSMTAGDLNADGRTDLVVGAYGIGKAYIFYNDGSYPTAAASADVTIAGEATSTYFGDALATGDLNADGKMDIVVGAYGYASNTGKAYIFYSQNGQVNTNRSIAGESTNQDFGRSFVAGDFNADGKTDLAVGAENYDTGSANVGRVYIFYNDGSYPTAGASADAIITSSAGSGAIFGRHLVAGDLNSDGKIDLVASEPGSGKVYLFYNDGSYPSTSGSADLTISSVAVPESMTTGDFNADGRTDLAVGDTWPPGGTNVGRVHIFYNDGSFPATADVVIDGQNSGDLFGKAMIVADMNADGKDDIVVGTYAYSSNAGRTYIFYADGTNNFGTATCSGTPAGCSAANADVVIDGAASSGFGNAFASGDFNADGKVDLAVGGTRYNGGSWAGRAYIFYADGTNNFGTATCSGTPAGCSAANADVVIDGEAAGAFFGEKLVAGDFNADGRSDLAVGAYGVTTNTGKAYIFHNDGSSFGTVACTTGCLAANADVIITGETTSNYFGAALISGDFNADGRTDLVVGAYGNTTNTGKAYFYETRENFAWTVQPVSGLRVSPNFSGQEMKITGESGTTGKFGSVFATGDFNADGKTDLVVGASEYDSDTGRAYIFYNDGSIPPGAPSADVIITGEAASNFGASLASGDFNADGKIDLAVGAHAYSTSTGRTYLFYNDGSYPSTAATADVIIAGETTNNYFGYALVSGDFNADGKTDLAVGATAYSSSTGRTYIFYNDGSYPAGAASADAIITGEHSFDFFGNSFAAGDFNADGKTDLAVGAPAFLSTARAYIFYNDGSYPSAAASADVRIIDGAVNGYLGSALAAGDFNQDGKTDLAVGAGGYSSITGRAYIFYNDGSYPSAVASADVIITGEASSYFGQSLASGDFNQDGKTDLAVGAYSYSTVTGRTYIFYSDGSIPTTAATADLILQGEATNSYYGATLAAGDFNADGKTDLVVGAYGYGSNKGRTYLYTFQDGVITGEAGSYLGDAVSSLATTDLNGDGRMDLIVAADVYSSTAGRVYIFYNDGLLYPASAASADVIITGEAGSGFGQDFAFADFNADGKTDMVVSALYYSSNSGRTYIFYSDGSIPTTAAAADVVITGETTNNYFGVALAVADFNADGRIDLVAGASRYSSSAGRVYIFYNDGSVPTTAATADIIISGEGGSFLGTALAVADFNADGRTDLAVGAYAITTNTGKTYIFYNDGSIPTTAATADVKITGEATGSYFGFQLTSGDFNADGKTDLAVGTYSYGRAYIFYNDGSIPTTAATADVVITGEAGSSFSQSKLASGDFNADGKTDLAVGAINYSTNTGRAYIFYNDGSYPSTAATADVILTGAASGNYYGSALVAGDFNADGITDLAIGAYGYSSNAGRVYVIISEAKAIVDQTSAAVRGNAKLRGNVHVR